jgi:hypothetical protein
MAERLEAQEHQREADQLAHQQQMAEMIAFLQSVGAQTGVALRYWLHGNPLMYLLLLLILL